MTSEAKGSHRQLTQVYPFYLEVILTVYVSNLNTDLCYLVLQNGRNWTCILLGNRFLSHRGSFKGLTKTTKRPNTILPFLPGHYLDLLNLKSEQRLCPSKW